MSQKQSMQQVFNPNQREDSQVRYYSYEEFVSDSHRLTGMIDWEFDAIIGISRGGLTLSHLLGEYYDIRQVYTINTIGYDDTVKLESTKVFNIPDITTSKNVLIVDDIVDSGDTLELVLGLLSEQYPQCNFKSASLFYKQGATVEPNWYSQIAKQWIDFFWSIDLKNLD